MVFIGYISIINMCILFLAKFHVHKNRFEKIWDCVCPSHFLVHCLFVVTATIGGVSLLKLAGRSLLFYNRKYVSCNYETIGLLMFFFSVVNLIR